MPRLDRRYNGIDVIRIFNNNLDINSKRLVIAWFFSTLPLKEPKVDVLQFILDLVGLIPIAGTAGKIFEISRTTAQVIKDIADLFGLEFEDVEIELAKVKKELETAEEEIRRQRNEIVELQLEVDRLNERIQALLATQELLEDELRQMQDMPERVLAQFRGDIAFIRARAERILRELQRLQRPTQPADVGLTIEQSANFTLSRVELIERRL